MRTVADSVQNADSMYIPRWNMPKMAPATPAKVPATTNAHQRMSRVLMPTNPARMRFSRTATRHRPNAEWQMSQSRAAEAQVTARVKEENGTRESSMAGTATPTNPSSPPVTLRHLNATPRPPSRTRG